MQGRQRLQRSAATATLVENFMLAVYGLFERRRVCGCLSRAFGEVGVVISSLSSMAAALFKFHGGLLNKMDFSHLELRRLRSVNRVPLFKKLSGF